MRLSTAFAVVTAIFVPVIQGRQPKLQYDYPAIRRESGCFIEQIDSAYPIKEATVPMRTYEMDGRTLSEGNVLLQLRDSGVWLLLDRNSKVADEPTNAEILKSESDSVSALAKQGILKEARDRAYGICVKEWKRLKLNRTNAR